MIPQQAPISTPEPQTTRFDKRSIIVGVLAAVAVVYVIASLYMIFDLRGKVAVLDQKEQALDAYQADLSNRLHMTSSELKEELSSEVGLTKQQIAERTAELERQQKDAASRLAAAQSRQGKELAAVTGEVGTVKTDVGSAKTDIQKTQTDLAATNAKLEKTIGDLGVASGLIAHNAQELELLKHKGDRNYYDFTLTEECSYAGVNHQFAVEEGGSQEEQIHAERDRR